MNSVLYLEHNKAELVEMEEQNSCKLLQIPVLHYGWSLKRGSCSPGFLVKFSQIATPHVATWEGDGPGFDTIAWIKEPPKSITFKSSLHLNPPFPGYNESLIGSFLSVHSK